MGYDLCIYKPFDKRGWRTVNFKQKVIFSNLQKKKEISKKFKQKEAMYILNFLYINEHLNTVRSLDFTVITTIHTE